ncbi:MAG: hypothetical protein ACI4WW_04365 [Candidatus Coprovivens sp.]
MATKSDTKKKTTASKSVAKKTTIKKSAVKEGLSTYQIYRIFCEVCICLAAVFFTANVFFMVGYSFYKTTDNYPAAKVQNNTEVVEDTANETE